MQTGDLEYAFQSFCLTTNIHHEEELQEDEFYSPLPSPDFRGFTSQETAEFSRKDTKVVFKKYDDESESESESDSEDERVHIHLRSVPDWLCQDMQILAGAWVSSERSFPSFQFPSEYLLMQQQRKLTVNEMMLIRRYALHFLQIYVEQHLQRQIEARDWFHLDHWAANYINRFYLFHFFV
jgi:hypothetical protein